MPVRLCQIHSQPFSLSPSTKLRTCLSKAVTGMCLGFDRLSPNGSGKGYERNHAATALRICSSTSFALAGIGVPGPYTPFTPDSYKKS